MGLIPLFKPAEKTGDAAVARLLENEACVFLWCMPYSQGGGLPTQILLTRPQSLRYTKPTPRNPAVNPALL